MVSASLKLIGFMLLAVYGYVVVYGPDDLPPVVQQTWSLTPEPLRQALPSIKTVINP